MRRIITLILLLALASPLNAAGIYDGIYSVSVSGISLSYASVHEVNNQMVVIIVDPDPSITWEPLIGVRSGNSVSLTHISSVSPSDINLDVTVNLNDSGTSTATINSCSNGINYVCRFPNGQVLNLDKIF